MDIEDLKILERRKREMQEAQIIHDNKGDE